jgi:hypothetical protein
MAIFAITRHAPTRGTREEQVEFSRKNAEKLRQIIVEMCGEVPVGSLVLTSPADRAVLAANAYSEILGSAKMKQVMELGDEFDIDYPANLYRLGKVIDTALKNHPMVIAVTHYPTIRGLLAHITTGHLGQGSSIYGPNYNYGVHVVDFESRYHTSFGLV